MSTLKVDNLYGDNIERPIEVSRLDHCIIKSYHADYTQGQWNPGTSFAWVPGQFVDYTPASGSSRIRVYCQIPMGGINAAHAISHWIFYANGNEIGRHNASGNHYEENLTYTWDFASWGTTEARIGYQMRSYSNDSNEVRVYTGRYWDGGGSQQNFYGAMSIQEYLLGTY